MSTKLFVLRIPQAELWPFVRVLKEIHKAQSFEHRRFNTHVAAINDADSVERMRYEYKRFSHAREDQLGLKESDTKDDTVELQCFDNGDGFYYIRTHGPCCNEEILAHPILKEYVKEINYDDRCDIPEEDIENEQHAIWIDEKITQGEYLIVPIITHSDLFKLWWSIHDLYPAWKEKMGDVGDKSSWTPQEQEWEDALREKNEKEWGVFFRL